MRHLIYFLLFSTVVFSQNYHYAIDDAPIKVVDNSTVTEVKNQLEEIEYFNAYLLPISDKASLQSAIDKYGAVRLEKGDYSGVDIILKSNQKLYGHPSLTRVSNITIAAGSSGVVLRDLFPVDKSITLQAGGVITNCSFKSIKWATLKATNAMVENNEFINYMGHIQLDCSKSGYIRNNKIIRQQSGTVSNVLVMKGNSATPSYGNVHVWTNILTPHGDATDIDNLQSATFVGMDAEAWNLTNEGTKAMFYAHNMGNVKITDFNGGNGGSPFKTPSYDIDANNLFFLSKVMNADVDLVSSKTNVTLVDGLKGYSRSSGTVKGYDFLGNLDYSNSISYNGVTQTAAITDKTVISSLSSSILGTQYTPWARPIWENLPDPLGVNWKTDRVGKPDSTVYIQGLIDKGIAQLPEGKFYISSTLKIPSDGLHGIVGQGTGKTVIVGMTDDFPIISLLSGADGSIQLAYLTIQGGSVGFNASTNYGALNIAYQNMKFVVFRNQNYGIHLNKTGGFDNNFLENISFVNCNIGFFQEPGITAANGESNTTYVDKTVFYNSQFLNCNTAFSMLATRANNLNAWINCKFKGGDIALDLASQNAPIIANCDFSDYKGNNVINSNTISMYSCKLYNNTVTASTIKSSYVHIEGCDFLDSSDVFQKMIYTSLNHYIINSTITGNAVVNIPYNQGYYPQSAIFMNSKLVANASLSKLLVNIKQGVPTVLLDGEPQPYPQLLVIQ